MVAGSPWSSIEALFSERLECDFLKSVANEFKVHKKGKFNSFSVVCLVVSYVQHVGSISTTP